MLYGILADAVTVTHLAFILFVAAGALLAVRWPWLVWAHLPALAWGLGTVTIGFTCPLTSLEGALRRLAGEDGLEGGFVDRYVEGVVYPERHTALLRVLAAVAVVAGYVVLYRRARRSRFWTYRRRIVPSSQGSARRSRQFSTRRRTAGSPKTA